MIGLTTQHNDFTATDCTDSTEIVTEGNEENEDGFEESSFSLFPSVHLSVKSVQSVAMNFQVE
jgi:hypothetical protein